MRVCAVSLFNDLRLKGTDSGGAASSVPAPDLLAVTRVR